MSDQKLTIDLRGVGNDIPTRLGKSRPTLTLERVHTEEGMERYVPGRLEGRRSSTEVEQKQEDRPV